jgi:hypothetical protein
MISGEQCWCHEHGAGVSVSKSASPLWLEQEQGALLTKSPFVPMQ